MVLKENDINKFNKKVIVDVFFNNGEEKGDIIMNLEFYYDAGHGVTRPKPKASAYKFACDVSKQAKEDPDNIFSFDKTDGYIETEKIRKVNVVDKNIIGDKQQLMTVIRNFISNAIKHTDTKIIVTIDKGVKVFNEGKPIDEDKLNGIWYTFVTHDKTGTGLGLAICRSILELHNYQYGVTNKENGVEFYFSIK